jgi:hypothetical protein
MAENVKKILLGLVFVVLFLPLSQLYVPVIESAPLHGAFHPARDTNFSIEQWIDGSYQEVKGKYIADNISFRSDLIRLNCQMDFSLFGRANTGWGVIGKDGCVFDVEYINAYTGNDFVGRDSLYNQLRKLKALQDTFARLGKSLVLVHAASKGYYYSECIPDKYRAKEYHPTNFRTCVGLADSLGVNQINMNAWFCAMKDTSKRLLYSKQGIHWTKYGGMLAGDSLIRYVEKLRKISMPHPKWEHMQITDFPVLPDNDIVSALNLIWPPVTEKFCYGDIVCKADSTKAKPNAIYIGDSFTVTLIENGVFSCINTKWEFWFYFRELHTNENPGAELPISGHDWTAALDKADYIALIYNAANLRNLGSGFIEAAYAHYFPGRE